MFKPISGLELISDLFSLISFALTILLNKYDKLYINYNNKCNKWQIIYQKKKNVMYVIS
jgi:hypothetical protein